MPSVLEMLGAFDREQRGGGVLDALPGGPLDAAGAGNPAGAPLTAAGAPVGAPVANILPSAMTGGGGFGGFGPELGEALQAIGASILNPNRPGAAASAALHRGLSRNARLRSDILRRAQQERQFQERLKIQRGHLAVAQQRLKQMFDSDQAAGFVLDRWLGAEGGGSSSVFTDSGTGTTDGAPLTGPSATFLDPTPGGS